MVGIYAMIGIVSRELCAQIADIVHPVDPSLGAEASEDESFAGDTSTADAKRVEYLQRLLAICDLETRTRWDDRAAERADDGMLPDPVVYAVREMAGQLRVLQGTLYELIAYAREFAPPGRRKYTLQTLADAAGMSTSGISTCYNEVITARAAESLQFGALRRNAQDDPRWRLAREQSEGKTWPDFEDQPPPPHWANQQQTPS